MVKDVPESLRVAGLVQAKPRLCWRNTVNLIYELPEYWQATYVEGIVLDPRHPDFPQEHGWVERDGDIIDPTLPALELQYFPALKWVNVFNVLAMEGECNELPFFRTSHCTVKAVCPEIEDARRLAQEWAKTFRR